MYYGKCQLLDVVSLHTHTVPNVAIDRYTASWRECTEGSTAGRSSAASKHGTLYPTPLTAARLRRGVEDVDALPDSRQPRSRVQHLPLQRASPAQRLGLHTHVQACNHITPSVLCVKACRCLVV